MNIKGTKTRKQVHQNNKKGDWTALLPIIQIELSHDTFLEGVLEEKEDLEWLLCSSVGYGLSCSRFTQEELPNRRNSKTLGLPPYYRYDQRLLGLIM